MTMINEDELYHFGVKGMKWGVRHARKRAQNRRDRDLELTSRFAKLDSDYAKYYRATAKKHKNMSDDDFAKMFDDRDLLKGGGGAHKSRLNAVKSYNDYADSYAKSAKEWAKAHKEIMNTPIDAYVKDRKIGKKIITKMLNE